MPNAKHAAAATDAAGVAESVALDRTTIIREQSALFPTRLALGRWMMGGDFPHLHDAGAARLPLRAAWYASATRNFQDWLDCGGFAQHDEIDAANERAHQPPVADGPVQPVDACI